MAIIISNDGDKVVETIDERDALVNRFDGMQVTVKDAIADVFVGGGVAGYVWDEANTKWLLCWTNTKDDIFFTTESHPLVGGEVVLNYVPASGLVWGCTVLAPGDVVAVEVSNPNVAGKVVNIGSTAYEGYNLVCTYAYGKIQAAVSEKINFSKSSFKDFSKDVSLPSVVVVDRILLEEVGTVTYQVQALSGNLNHFTSVFFTHNFDSVFFGEINSFYNVERLLELDGNVVGGYLVVTATTFLTETKLTSLRTLIGR